MGTVIENAVLGVSLSVLRLSLAKQRGTASADGVLLHIDLDAHELCQRPYPEFLHNLPAMYFDRPLADAQVRGDHFVHPAVRDAIEDLQLAIRQRGQLFS